MWYMQILVKILLFILDSRFCEFKWYRDLRKGVWYLVVRDKYGNGNSSGTTTNWENKKPVEDDSIGTYCKIVETIEY